MTSFENYFRSLKKVLGNETLYDFWPDFEPHYDEHEYAWATLRGLGEVLLLNCGICDGPSDLRHTRCRDCVEKRRKMARDAYKKSTGSPEKVWATLFLCRIHTE